MGLYEHDQAVSQDRDPLTLYTSIAICNALLKQYLACETWARDAARDAMPWFLERLKEYPDFELMFEVTAM